MKTYTLTLILLLGCTLIYAKEKIEGFYNPQTNTFDTESTEYWIDYFDGNFAIISKKGLVGLIDTSGTIICPAKYQRIDPFTQDCAIVFLNKKFGLIDIHGNLICPPKYDRIFPFKYKHTTVVLNKEYGIIDNKGCDILVPQLTFIHPFTTPSVTQFSHRNKKNQPITIGLINNKGKILMQTEDPLTIKPFSEGIATYSNHKSKEICFIDSLGNSIEIDLDYESLYTMLIRNNSWPLSESLKFKAGLALFALREKQYFKFGCLNKKGKIAIAPIFDMIYPFQGKYTIAKIKNYWHIIDKKGNVLLKDSCDYMQLIKDKWVSISKSGLSGVLNLKGDTIIPFHYNSLFYLFDELFLSTALSDSNNYNASDTIIPPYNHLFIRPMYYGVINHQLDTIIPFAFSMITPAINHKNDTIFIASKDTFASYISDLDAITRSSSFSYDKWVFAGFNTLFEINGHCSDSTKHPYKIEQFAQSITPPTFPTGRRNAHFAFLNYTKNKYYLINSIFPPPKYTIHSTGSNSVIIRKNNKFALVGLAGSILKPFSRQCPNHNLN